MLIYKIEFTFLLFFSVAVNDPEFMDDCNVEEDEDEDNEEDESDNDVDDGVPPLRANVNIANQRKFIVFESQLLELTKYCIKCGSAIDPSLTKEVEGTGSQLTMRFHCSSGKLISY